MMLKMLRISDPPDAASIEGDEMSAEADEPPDVYFRPRQCTSHNPHYSYYPKGQTLLDGKKESLLTRALMTSPELPPAGHPSLNPHLRHSTRNSTASLHSIHSGPSTAELTSDGETTSPPRSNTPSPPLPSHYGNLPPAAVTSKPSYGTVDAHELEVEANLGRKRCITFECGRKPDTQDQQKAVSDPVAEARRENCLERKSMLTFACPSRPAASEFKTGQIIRNLPHSRPRGSPAPPTFRPSYMESSTSQLGKLQDSSTARRTRQVPVVTGLGEFELSEATRFHEFASSLEEEDEWVNEVTDYKKKITLSDCLKKENAIRKLGEEAEEEARQDEEDELEDNEDEEDVVDEDDSTLHDGSSDDGNESDNEAGFADSDVSDDESEYGFWAPSMVTAATSVDHLDIVSEVPERRHSNTSIESLAERDPGRHEAATSVQKDKKRRHSAKAQKMRPGTPSLPDSTDFVCGTLDEDRPLEAAYISCMEERRRSRHVPIPQDIDPSFPTTDPEDDDDLDGDIGGDSDINLVLGEFNEDFLRGRRREDSRRTSPSHSPKRLHSPPPRRLLHSPKRLRSPPPPSRLRSPPATRRLSLAVAALHPPGINITGLAQRPNRTRTSSLPRTPNPFFAHLGRSGHSSPTYDNFRGRDIHTRGAIDIVEGLEKKRQKRKEKFWRPHCRKATKEQQERKPVPGKGAERMKELGLEVAERFRAYGIAQNTQLVLSI